MVNIKTAGRIPTNKENATEEEQKGDGQARDTWAAPQENLKFLWMSGEQVEWDKATVHASRLGWSAISMVFEGIRGYWNAEHEQLYIFHLDAHLKRLIQSMRVMRMRSPWTTQELSQHILKLVKANEFRGDIYIRPSAYFGEGTPRYLAVQERPGEIIIHNRAASSTLGSGKAVTCGVSSWNRISDNVMPPRVKAIGNYQNSRYVADESSRHGYEFGIILNQQGKITEISYACIFIVRDGVAITPPASVGTLESITSEVVTELLEKELGIPVQQRDIDRTELYIADEAFICGTGAEVQAISSIDGYQFGDGNVGPVVTKLEQIFHDVVRGKSSGHAEWRTEVY